MAGQAAEKRHLRAHVVPAGPHFDPAGARRALAERLPAYMVPERFVTTEALPRTPSGKVDRLALAAR